jgi:hypothetical protein
MRRVVSEADQARDPERWRGLSLEEVGARHEVIGGWSVSCPGVTAASTTDRGETGRHDDR